MKIEKIREKYIEANPEIEKEKEIDNVNINNPEGDPMEDFSAYKYDRPIRLADVLLAISVKDPKIHYGITDDGQFINIFDDSSFPWWDLKNDNLESQSKETIDFIHELLKCSTPSQPTK